jgi:hypothetical protein
MFFQVASARFCSTSKRAPRLDLHALRLAAECVAGSRDGENDLDGGF